ncbi:MAG: hypothetical protein IIC60_05515 [Proteobacteria bacterium]|nr:hypothetical protein [Pseudomonadota bacterium]
MKNVTDNIFAEYVAVASVVDPGASQCPDQRTNFLSIFHAGAVGSAQPEGLAHVNQLGETAPSGVSNMGPTRLVLVLPEIPN